MRATLLRSCDSLERKSRTDYQVVITVTLPVVASSYARARSHCSHLSSRIYFHRVRAWPTHTRGSTRSSISRCCVPSIRLNELDQRLVCRESDGRLRQILAEQRRTAAAQTGRSSSQNGEFIGEKGRFSGSAAEMHPGPLALDSRPSAGRRSRAGQVGGNRDGLLTHHQYPTLRHVSVAREPASRCSDGGGPGCVDSTALCSRDQCALVAGFANLLERRSKAPHRRLDVQLPMGRSDQHHRARHSGHHSLNLPRIPGSYRQLPQPRRVGDLVHRRAKPRVLAANLSSHASATEIPIPNMPLHGSLRARGCSTTERG